MQAPSFLFLLVICVILIGLSGCVALSERQAEDVGSEIPGQWHGAKEIEQQILEHWVVSFEDANLNALVHSALTNNYELKSAAARVDAAMAQARISGSNLWPQLFFSASHQQFQIRDAGFGASRFSVFEALFGLSWELDVWGRIRDVRQASVREAIATATDFHGARLSLAARVAQSYFELAEAKLQSEVAEQSFKDRQTIADLVQGRFQRGLTRALDLRLTLTDLANVEAQHMRALNKIQIITRRLEILLGRYPEGNLTEVSNLPELPAAIQAGLPSELLERRPDLVAAFDRLQAADLRLSSTEKLLLPRITLTASGGTRSEDLTDLIDPRAVAWNVILGLVQPIFTGGRIQGEIFRNEARAEEALNFYKSTALNAFREVEQALAAEEWLRKQEQALKKAVEQTEASQQLAVYSYRNGLIEILTLLDSYRSTFNAQSAYLSVKRQLLSNRINLYLALGGGV